MTARIAILLLAAWQWAAAAGAPRFDKWEVIGPGGGGGQFVPTISPHTPNDVLVSCDMTGAYITHDGGQSWRMFNLQGTVRFFLFDPADPKTIYVKTFGPPASMEKDRPATIAALFRSSDSGRTWRFLRDDSPASQLTALAVDPADSSVLYAGFRTPAGAILSVSTDRGVTWTRDAALPSPASRIYVDARSPRAARALYVAGANSVSIRENGSWSHPAGPAGVSSFVEVAGGFDGGNLIVYGAARSAIHVSRDGGRTWTQPQFPGGFTPSLRAVAASLNHGAAAYASYSGRVNNERVMGVAKTADAGRTWELAWKDGQTAAANFTGQWLDQTWGPGWGGNPISLGVDPNNPDLCYGTDNGRSVRTTDGGKTWRAVYSQQTPDGGWATTGLDVTTNYGVHFDPFDSQRMFIGYTDIGLFRSENGGKSWFAATTGVPKPWVNTTYWVAFDPQVKGRVWGAMSGVHDLPRPKMWQGGLPSRYIGGACRSDDGARTWDCTSDLPPTALTHVLLDAKSPAASRTLYATGFGRGVFKSEDGGKHWTLKNNGIAGAEPFAWRLAGDPRGALYVVVARRSNDGSIGTAGDGALYRTTDGAEHWSAVKLPEGVNGPHGLAIDPKDPKRLYLAAWGRRPQEATAGGGIYLSTDAGATWRRMLDRDQHIGDITIDPRDASVLYATGFESNAWRSADRGETWHRIRGFNFRWGQRVIPDPADRTKIYVTTYGGGVWHGPAEGDADAVEDVLPAIPKPSARELARVNYHRVTSRPSPAPEPGAENTPMLSPLDRPDGTRVRTPEEWYTSRRPELVKDWMAILGKVAPAPEDMKWFGDVTRATQGRPREMDGYTRIDFDIPIERDFYQRHLLLVPKGQGNGPFPAVIAWTSSTPDYQEPEKSWGAYLAQRGYVVLTSWSFIRNYREGSRSTMAAELVYQRFGHWLAMGKMVHDVAREVEYLRSLPQVDPKRIGFIGFSLSAKAAVYVAAFNPDIKATVAVDPHIAINGGTNWYAPWYLDWRRKFDDIHTPDYPVPELRGTVQSLLNPDVKRPGFEHDHQELMALAAPRAFLLIGGSQSEDAGGDSDDLQSWGYFNRAKEVYKLLGIPERLEFCSTGQGHHANGEQIDRAWQSFLKRYLKDEPIE